MIILWALGFLYLFYCGFLIYAAVMNVGWGKLSLFLKILLTPVGLVFLTADVAFNVSVGTLLFLQLPGPGTWTLSMRMANNLKMWPLTWRGKLSKLIVSNLLLPFTADY
jgi:hypothetical protein